MAIKLVREFKQNQQLSITPQLKKSIDLLQLSRLEIINKINNEIEENPFLKKENENQSTGSFDDMDLIDNLSNELTLQNHLENQLEDLGLSNSQKKISSLIIRSLEENGLLKIELDEIEEQMGFVYSINEIKSVLTDIIQDLDPAGIEQEILKKQYSFNLKDKKFHPEELEIANKILFNPQFSTFEDAKNELEIFYSKKTVENVLKKIKQCDLSPGLGFESTIMIQPDPK